MTGLTVTLALVLAVVAAARSTWSPCGLSMLSTITPLAEQGRGHRYGWTAGWFFAGAVLGGATLGTIMALCAALAWVSAPSAGLVAAVIMILALASVLVEAGLTPLRFPLFRRQVNEQWLDQFRPWFYGAGFGWQIGVGLLTYLMTPAVLVMIALAVLTGSPWWSLLTGVVFGTLRGAAVFSTRTVTSTQTLFQLHRRFRRLEVPVAWACLLTEGAVAAAAAGWLSPAAAAGSVAVVVMAAVGQRLRPATA
jgi:MFS family permease